VGTVGDSFGPIDSFDEILAKGSRMPYPFLSAEWMEASHQIRSRYAGGVADITAAVRMNQVITEVPFGDGVVHVFIDTSSGRLVLDYGQLDEPDLTLTTDYETARTFLVEQDLMGAMQAFMAGKVRVQGDMMKLMSLQTALPTDGTAAEIAGEIRAITE
jgi:putative sterol carrier protein